MTLKYLSQCKGWPDSMMMDKAKSKTSTKLYLKAEFKEKTNLQSLAESNTRSHWLTRSRTFPCMGSSYIFPRISMFPGTSR